MKFSEWKEYKLEDVTINYNSKRVPLSRKERALRQGRYPYYGAQGVVDFIDKFIFEGQYLLVAEDGANLETRNEDIARLTKNQEQFWVNNHAHILRSNENSDIRYIKYFLNKSDLSGYITGSAQPKLNKANLNSIRMVLPPFEEQKAIASILSCLDEKIETNRKINENLEKQAQALFKHWFVDFEFPNENGEPYKSSGGEMVDSELGMIPEGWEVKFLGDIIELLDSKRIPLSKKEREIRENIYPYYGAASQMDYVDEYLFEGTHVLLGEDGTVIDEKGYPILQYVWGKFWVNNHAHVIKGKKTISENFIYLLLKNTSVSSAVTGAVQPKINQKNLKSLKVILPISECPIYEFSEKINSGFEKIKANVDETKNLTKLRDTLLPKLMSGEIRVPLEDENIEDTEDTDKGEI